MSMPPNDPRADLSPTLTAAELSQLAAARPDLGAAIVWHPNTYPQLVSWIAQHGAPEARAVAAQRLAGQPHPAVAVPVSAAPGYPGGPHGDASGAAPLPQPAEPKRRRGLLIGAIAAGSVIVLGGGGALAWSLLAPKGAATPTGAVEKLVDVVTGDNLLGGLSLLAPSESELVSGIVESASGIRFGEVSYDAYLADAYAAFSFQDEDLVYEETTITDDVVRVSVIGGSLTIDADADRLADVMEAFVRDHAETFADYTGADPGDLEAELEEGREDLVADIAESFPVTVDFAAEVDSDGITPFQAVVVDEGGWYLSPVLSVADLALTDDARAERDDVIGDAVIEARPSSSPEAALDDAIAGFNEWQATGALAPFVERLPLAERRLLSLYAPDLDLIEPTGLEITDHRETWLPGGGDAVFQIDAVTLTQQGMEIATYESGCLSPYGGRPMCLTDLPFAAELGLDTPVGIVAEVEGGWQFSPLSTIGTAIERALDGFAEAAEDGDLSELMEP